MSKQNNISLNGIDKLLDVMTRISPAQTAIDNIHILESIQDDPIIQMDSFIKTSLRGLIKENKEIRSQEEFKYKQDSAKRRQQYLQEEWQRSSQPRSSQSRRRQLNNQGTNTSRQENKSLTRAHRRQDNYPRQQQKANFAYKPSRNPINYSNNSFPQSGQSLPGLPSNHQSPRNPGSFSNNTAATRQGNLERDYDNGLSSPSDFYRPSRSSGNQPLSESNGLPSSQSTLPADGLGSAHLDMHD